MSAGRLTGPLAQALSDLPGDWDAVVQPWLSSPAATELMARVDERVAAGAVVYPEDPLRALRLTPLASTRVVILGQDPYHGAGQAEGLAFSVAPGTRVPPSLRNILTELERDLGIARPAHGHLGAWARQGILLLNTCLTVEEGQAGSHAKLGWQALTSRLVVAASNHPTSKVFMLWGAHAQTWRADIEAAAPGRHRILCANHPSPLSCRRPPIPFVDCGHFSQADAHLRALGATIDWRL